MGASQVLFSPIGKSQSRVQRAPHQRHFFFLAPQTMATLLPILMASHIQFKMADWRAASQVTFAMSSIGTSELLAPTLRKKQRGQIGAA